MRERRDENTHALHTPAVIILIRTCAGHPTVKFYYFTPYTCISAILGLRRSSSQIPKIGSSSLAAACCNSDMPRVLGLAAASAGTASSNSSSAAELWLPTNSSGSSAAWLVSEHASAKLTSSKTTEAAVGLSIISGATEVGVAVCSSGCRSLSSAFVSSEICVRTSCGRLLRRRSKTRKAKQPSKHKRITATITALALVLFSSTRGGGGGTHSKLVDVVDTVDVVLLEYEVDEDVTVTVLEAVRVVLKLTLLVRLVEDVETV